jgi:RimJ/RimL family protein N-acetyltransferase
MNPFELNLPYRFSTLRLSLRRYCLGDGSVYYNALCANRKHLYEFMPEMMLKLQSAEDAEGFIRWQNAEWEARSVFIFGMWENATGNYVGESYLANADWRVPCIETGYFVLKEYTRRGFASEALWGITRYAFEQMGVTRVELQCSTDNDASRGVAEKCGFVYEGRLRQRNRKKDGSLVDRLWFGLLRSEWEDAS